MAVSTILDEVLTRYIPDQVLKSLRLKKGDEIVWKYDSKRDKVYIEKRKPMDLLEFEGAKTHSENLSRLLLALEPKSKTFNELQKDLKVSPRTASRLLSESEKQGFVEHEGRNKPYSLSQRGYEFLKIIESMPLEGNDVNIHVVKEGPFVGSIILRLPSRIGKTFSERLYTPEAMEDMNRIMVLALEFWVRKHSNRSPGVKFVYYGKDFNNDGLEDLIITETPQGYPNIRKAMQEDRIPGPLIECAYAALEERLKKTVS
jgi:DNA-binding MarR family transcriptional regulator